jgi:hypothetical protein
MRAAGGLRQGQKTTNACRTFIKKASTVEQ